MAQAFDGGIKMTYRSFNLLMIVSIVVFYSVGSEVAQVTKAGTESVPGVEPISLHPDNPLTTSTRPS
jgi:hypothetical protein